MARTRLAPTLLLALALGAAGCGGSGGEDKPAKPRPGAGGRAAHTAKAADVRVIRGWVDTLRAGHVSAAAGYFAVPAVVQNGTPPVRLRTLAEVRAFNKDLPCGAKLLRTVAAGRYVAAVFRLTERPGGRCGSGRGQRAATAFVIRAGKIAEWRRIPLPPQPSSPPGEKVPLRVS